MPDYLDKLLGTDGLAEAEKITGKSYKEDEDTMRLGFGLHIANTEAKAQALRERGDTTFSFSWDDTVRIFRELGFSIVHGHRFDGGYAGHEDERFVVLWRPDGVLATAESYGRDRNTANLYYNWRPTSEEALGNTYEFTSSGGFHTESYDRGEKVWVGQHDVREAMRYKLSKLEAHGEFLPAWVERPFLWLLDYSQPKVAGYDYTSINEDVIASLPEHVRSAITPGHVELEVAS